MTGDPFPIEKASDRMKTCWKLAALFLDFALNGNEKVKIWVGFRVMPDGIRGSLLCPEDTSRPPPQRPPVIQNLLC